MTMGSGGSGERGIGARPGVSGVRQPPVVVRRVPPRRRIAVAAAACLVLSSCAYYNGMYNANRFASQAEASERAGRIAESRERWGRAAVHAESVLTRHPRSRWADDAMLVRGRALVHTLQYTDAAGVLVGATRVAGSPAQQGLAHVYLGRAWIGMGLLADAESVLVLATEAPRDEIADQGWWHLGRARLAQGRAEAALLALAQTRNPAAALDKLRAGILLRDSAVVQAALVAATARFNELEWSRVVDSLAQAGFRAAAAAATEGLLAREDVSSGAKARALLADGRRLLAVGDRAAAQQRFAAIAAVAPDSSETRSARVELLRLEAEAATDAATLAQLVQPLNQIAALGGTPARDADPLLRLLARLDSLAAEMPDGAADAAWYLRAELVRDSLRAPELAARLFGDMDARFPASPWTPKALLAALLWGHPAADSLAQLLRTRYAESPYVRAAGGSALDSAMSAAYVRLEDSLRVTLDAFGDARRVTAPGPPRRPGARDRQLPADQRP